MIKSSISASAESATDPATAPGASSSKSQPATDSVKAIRQQAQDQFGKLGETVAEAFPAAVLHTIAGSTFGGAINAGGFKAYLDSTLKTAGDPSDPVESMLIDQLVWAHHQIGVLFGKAAHATTLQEAEVYNLAVARIMSEFRRSTLALREYRSGPAPKQLTVVRQQNVAAGNQNVAMVDGNPEQPQEKDLDIELGTDHARLTHVEFSDSLFATTGCRAAEPVEAKRPVAPRARKAAANRLAEPPLEIFHGTENGDRQG